MQKNNYIFKNISVIFSNKMLQIFTIILLLVFGYFCSTLDSESAYFESLTMALTYQQFITLCFLPMLMLSNLLVIQTFEKNSMLIIRFENKKRYIKELLKNVFFGNTIVFFTVLLTVLTFFNFFSNGDLSIRYIERFHTTNILYVSYVIVKLYILSLIFSMIFTFLLKLINKNCALILTLLVTASLYVCQWFSFPVVDKLYKMPLYFGNYFLDITEYSTFTLNVTSFIIMTMFLSIFLFVLYKLTMKKMKAVGE